MRVSQLMPYGTDTAKSYYGKALLIEDGDFILLQSYDTIVAMYNKKTHLVTMKGWFSMTTGRHIRSFLEFLGVRVEGLLVGSKSRSFKQFIENHRQFFID